MHVEVSHFKHFWQLHHCAFSYEFDPMKRLYTEPAHGTIFVVQLGRPGHSAVAVAVAAAAVWEEHPTSEAVRSGLGAEVAGDDSALGCCYAMGTCGAVGWVVRYYADTSPSGSDADGCC